MTPPQEPDRGDHATQSANPAAVLYFARGSGAFNRTAASQLLRKTAYPAANLLREFRASRAAWPGHPDKSNAHV